MDPATTAKKIKSMEVRGALEIALAAAGSLREYAQNYKGVDFLKDFRAQAETLRKSRPTATSLPNTLDYLLYLSGEFPQDSMPKLIDTFIAKQVEARARIAEIGAKRVRNGDVILTHCNSETALEVIREAAKTKRISVVCTETRPRNQGYITAAFMAKSRIPVTLIVDSAVRYAMEELDISKVIVGADVVTANGAVGNKIGTSQVALMAHEANLPFIVTCETIKFSPQTFCGQMIPVEERKHSEIRPRMKGVKMWNPAFDFTPPEYIDSIITEDGMISPHMAYEILKDKFAWELCADRTKRV
jgi:ribose 1,5-bisphosphate isomerase